MASEPVEPLTSHTSGSAGSLTASHNQFGRYTRARTLPFDPATALQQVIRDAMSTLTARWTTVLTRSQRDAWDAYALAVSLTGPAGKRNDVGGLGMYVRSNVPRIQAAAVALQVVDQAPTRYSLPSPTGGTTEPIGIERVVLNPVDDTFHPFYANEAQWLNDLGSGLLFWTSAPQPTTVNFFKGPYRFAASILAQPLGFFPSPATLALSQAAAVGQRVFVRARLTRTDGRLTNSKRFTADQVPQVAPRILTAVRPSPFALFVDCTFDALLRDELHNLGNWFVRLNNLSHAVTNVAHPFQPAATLKVFFLGATPNPGPDRLIFSPPPNDLNGLLTGIPVAPFSKAIT